MNVQETKDLNAIMNALVNVPVVRSSIEGTGRATLLFTERRIIAETLLPLIREVRNEGQPKSQD